MSKRIVCFIMSIILTMGVMVGFDTNEVYAISQNDVVAQLNSLAGQYNGKTATSSQLYLGTQCKGFANWVFSTIFGVYIGPYSKDANYKIPNPNAQTVGIIEPGNLNVNTARELLQKGAPGDFIQVQRSTARGRGPHSMILMGVNGNGIEVLDCNSDGKDTIKKYSISWADFDTANRAMSLYRAKGYSPSASPSTGNLPAGNSQKAPVGIVDAASGGANSITVSGWAYDPNDPSQTIYVDIYVGGPADSGAPGYRIVANKERTDVGNVYGVGDNHGFSQTLDVDRIGTQTLYFYAIGNGNPLIGTKTVTIKQLPVGVVDEAKGGVHSIIAGGWAYDPDEPSKSVDVHIYVGGPAGSGAPGYAFTANQQRADVGNMFGVGDYHGYSGTISTDLIGTQTLFFYIIDSEGLNNKFLGTKSVTVEPENGPHGVVDYAAGGTDSISVAGWAYDEDDVSQTVCIHIYSGDSNGPDKLIAAIAADKKRTDVGELGVGNHHGFSDVIQTDITGRQTLYFYGIDIGGSTNTFLGSKEVEVKQGKSPIGCIDGITGGKGSIRVNGWTLDEDTISKPIFVHAYIGGPAGSGAPGHVICANKERTDIGKLYPGAGNYHGYDETIVTGKRGEQEVYLYAIDEGSLRDNTYLGYCTVDIQDAEVSEEHIHEYTEKIIREATCTGEGEKQYVCNCGDSFSEIIGKTSHTVVEEKAKQATCTEDGYTEKSYCSVCGMIIKASEMVEKTAHKNTEVRYQKAATCLESGYTGDTYCTDCGAKVKEGTETAQTEHNWDKGMITKEATDTEAGIKTFTCSLCGSAKIEVIPCTGSAEEDEKHVHKYVEETVKPADCTEDGEKKFVCACGDFYTEPIQASGHDWDEGIVTKQPTGTASGIKTYTCTICKMTKTEAVPPIKVNEGEGNTEDGEDEELEVLYKGDIVYDVQRKAKYEVISVKADEIKVGYVEPFNKKESDVKIPDEIETEEGIVCQVTAVLAGAFQNNKYIKKVTVGNNVTTIGKKAFSGCKNLTSMKLGTNLTTIGNNAFSRCGKLTKLTLPAEVSKIGSNVFYGCKKLKTLVVLGTKITAKGTAKKAFSGMSAKLTVQTPESKAKFYKRLFRQKGLNARAKVIAKKG